MKKNTSLLIVSGTFLILGVWWLWANITGNADQKELFSDSYWILPLICGLTGLAASKKWGGLQSLFGKAVFFLSVGLLLQVFGQVIYSYYARVQHIEAPYPSIGDIGFFGGVIAYILGAYYLSKTVGVRISAAKVPVKIIAVLVPLGLLALSYYVFLSGYDYDTSQALTTFLDFGYPFGQAVYLAITILAYLLSAKMLGGVMRSKILLVLGALVAQYIAEFTFLFRFSREQYTPGELADLLYLLAYIGMGVALISLIKTYESLSSGPAQRIAAPTTGANNGQ